MISLFDHFQAIDHAPDATLYSNRSLCRLQMGDGEGALSDAYKCRMMRPDWAKGCYRQGAAHMLLGVRYTLLACQYFYPLQILLRCVYLMWLDLLRLRSTNKPMTLFWTRRSWILEMKRLRENYGNLLPFCLFFCACITMTSSQHVCQMATGRGHIYIWTIFFPMFLFAIVSILRTASVIVAEIYFLGLDFAGRLWN